ncbi:tetratricopeptide (TPR) repeat protein/transcriptional regulator with XRE-family HTH domain [Streptomyces canus]|uniref:Tetratricopeptide (TPR) repeat protein/transcriptional regulator with XRE-family HTH domain n=2 Tax=Streptomyces canus TaxID=58343 RepID=A0AAW8F6C2_9ACTN|nr:tetratricopeptide (TPR) repeat protein/transcriptional regulator with XRE-family HTH domain [Streptomyces canus]
MSTRHRCRIAGRSTPYSGVRAGVCTLTGRPVGAGPTSVVAAVGSEAMTQDEPDFGALLRELRQTASMTIEGLSEASGVSVRGIGELERGRRTAPQRRTVNALADGLGLAAPQRRRLVSAARAGRSDGYTPVGVQVVPPGHLDFVGRERELAYLTGLARRVADRRAPRGGGARTDPDGPPAVVAVSGPPGMGKTTLALQAARRLTEDFPDVQIVVDMRGLDAEPPTPAELMLGVLRALRVADREVAKAGPEGHVHLYRQTLAQRRFALVLDNARDEAQVRPLLPGSGTGIVVVTSRRMLTGLEGVHRLGLDGLDRREATMLLSTLVGDERADDTAALDKIAQYCGHLPLALRLAGSWLAVNRTAPVARLVERLAPDEERLRTLAARDLEVSAAFDLSYRQLSTPAARMFRRLALVPGSDVSAAGAAQLCGQSSFDAEDTLEELVEAGLLGVERDRYRMHDLLRLYAQAKLDAEEDAQDKAEARAALCDWLLRTAIVAGRWFEPGAGTPPGTPNGDVNLSSADRGRAWLQDEGANWLAALRAAGQSGRHALVVEVAESLHWFSDQWIYWGYWPEVFGMAADSAEVLGDPVLQATHLNYLAWARLLCQGRYRDSLTHSVRALALARQAGDTCQQAWAYVYQGWAHRELTEYETAAEHMSRAGHLFETAQDPQGSLTALHGVALILADSGRSEEAIGAYRRALDFLETAGDRIEPHAADFARAGSYSGLARSCESLGRTQEAVAHLRKSVDISERVGNIGLESRYLRRLGELLLGMGRTVEAREALSRLVSLGPYADPDAAREAAALIASLDARTSTGDSPTGPQDR